MSDIMPPVPPQRVLPDRPVGWELLLFLLVLLLIVVLGVFVLAAVGDVAFGPQTGEALRRGLPSPDRPQESWIYLGVFALFYLAVIAATWIAMFPHRGRRASALGLRPAKWQWFVFGTIGVLALSQAADALLLPFLRDVMAIGGDELQITLLIRALTATTALTVVAVGVLAVLAPLAEELVFRGLLYGWLRGFLPFDPDFGAVRPGAWRTGARHRRRHPRSRTGLHPRTLGLAVAGHRGACGEQSGGGGRRGAAGDLRAAPASRYSLAQ
jgi:membrane protease YdiL (CAAX protease family)